MSSNAADDSTTAAPSAPEGDSKLEQLNIKISDNQNEVWFKVKPHTKVSKMCKAWCDRNGQALSTVRFLFDGVRIVLDGNDDNATAASLGMEDQDSIEVFREQQGGATPTPTEPEPENVHEASPSPPPKAPIAMTPGPRAAAFTTLYEKTLSHTIDAITYDNFADCFPSIAENAPETLKYMHETMQGALKQKNKSQFDTLVQERNVIANLNSLEDLINDAKRRKARSTDDTIPPTAPHLLPAPVVESAHLASLYASQQSQLNAKLQTVASQNATLADKISAQKQEIEKLVRSVEAVVGDLDKTNEALADVDALAKDARKAEAELMEIA